MQGPEQAAPRAEGFAGAKVLDMVRGPISMVTDSTLVMRKLKDVQFGRQVTGMHQMDWDQAAAHIGKLVAVQWV